MQYIIRLKGFVAAIYYLLDISQLVWSLSVVQATGMKHVPDHDYFFLWTDKRREAFSIQRNILFCSWRIFKAKGIMTKQESVLRTYPHILWLAARTKSSLPAAMTPL